MAEMTRAATYLTYVGNTLYVLGTAIGAIGTLHAVNKISGHGIKALNAIPGLVSSQIRESPRVQEGNQQEEQLHEAPTIASAIKQEIIGYCSIGTLVLAGGALVFVGKKLVAPETLERINRLYK
jgi:hypothetical protein